MTPHHPAVSGLVEQLHRTLKAAIMCHADEQWTEALPLVLNLDAVQSRGLLLGFSTALLAAALNRAAVWRRGF